MYLFDNVPIAENYCRHFNRPKTPIAIGRNAGLAPLSMTRMRGIRVPSPGVRHMRRPMVDVATEISECVLPPFEQSVRNCFESKKDAEDCGCWTNGKLDNPG